MKKHQLICALFLFQCMICLRVPQASLGRLFAVDLKMPHSYRSVLWTAVLASSPLSILKAKISPSLHCCWHPESFCSLSPFVLILLQTLRKRMSRKSTQYVTPQMCLWRAGLDGLSCDLLVCLQLPPFPSGFASDQQDCLFKGNSESHYWISVTSQLSTFKGHQWDYVHVKM